MHGNKSLKRFIGTALIRKSSNCSCTQRLYTDENCILDTRKWQANHPLDDQMTRLYCEYAPSGAL